MAKIPTILEAGRADGKLAESQAIYDSILKQFQSDINGEYKLTKQQVEFLLPIVERLNDVQDTLTSIEADKPLSAQQGKILKELLDAKVIESGNVPMDSEPMEGNTDHVVTSDGIRKSFNKVNDKINLSKDEESIYPSDIFNQININEYIYVQLDSNNKLIFGILPDGDIVYGFGVPSKIQESINNIAIEQTNAIKNLTEALNIEKQRALMAEEQLALKLSKLNYEYEKDNNILKLGNKRYKLIEDGNITNYDFYILSFETIDNPEYKYVITDKNNIILYSEKQDGTIFKAELDDPILLDIVEYFIETHPINWKDYVLSVQKDVENPEYKVVYLDESNKILYSININDVIYNPDITHDSTTDESITGKDLSSAINYMESNNRPQKDIEYDYK